MAALSFDKAQAVLSAIDKANSLNRKAAPLRTVVWDVDGTLVTGRGWDALRALGPQLAHPEVLRLVLGVLRRRGVMNVVVSRNMGFVISTTHAAAERALRALGFDAVVQGFRHRIEPKTAWFGGAGVVLIDDHLLECEAAVFSGATALKVPPAFGVIDGVATGRATVIAAQSTFK